MQDLRSFMELCEKRLPDEFVRVTKEVDPKYEITAVVKKMDLLGRSPMMVFEKVRGSAMSVVCNTDTDLNKFALAFGVTPDRVDDFYGEKEEEAVRLNKYAFKEVDRRDAPCKEIVLAGKKANLRHFPFLVHHENEVPYLTRAVGIVTDEKNAIPHTAHYRFMVKGPYLGVTHITPGRHFWDIYNERKEQKRSLEIAFAVGLHPSVGMGTQSRVSHPPSEFDVAGSLLGESVEMVRCETIDVLVPAQSEIVIEGEIPFGAREAEGPWGDFTRYHQVADRHPVRIKAITHRKNPIVHDMGAWPSVGGLPLVRIPAHAYMNRKIKEAVPDVKRFLFLPEAGWFYGFIQLDKKHAGQPKQAILAAFASELYLKYVAVFDTDIDIENPAQMAWALATRVQADRDLLILPGVLGTDLDLSAHAEAVLTKVGIDATAKPFRKNLPPVAGIPDAVMKRIDLKEYIPNIKKFL